MAEKRFRVECVGDADVVRDIIGGKGIPRIGDPCDKHTPGARCSSIDCTPVSVDRMNWEVVAHYGSS